MPTGALGPEVEVDRAVGVRFEVVVRRVGRVTAGTLEHRARGAVVDRQRPEGRRRYVSRYVQAVALVALKAPAFPVLERLDVVIGPINLSSSAAMHCDM